MKLLAKELNVPMMVLSQLSRAVETRQGDHRPQLATCANPDRSSRTPMWWASSSAKKSTIAIAKICKGLAELIIAKQRNGPVGTVNLVFLHAQTKFENRAEDTGEHARGVDLTASPLSVQVSACVNRHRCEI